MKKNLYFIAIFALCCVFILKADISYASDVLEPVVITDGYLLSSVSCSGYDFFSGYAYEGTYPSTATLIQSWGTGSPFNTPYINPVNISMEADPAIYSEIWIKLICGHYGYPPTYSDSYIYAPLYSNGSTWADVKGASITITAPTTGTTITDTATTLNGAWAGLDPDIYKNITLYFSSHFIGEQSVAKLITITASSGTFSLPLSDFGLSANGQWDLRGNATYKNTQLSDMYITTDLISPAGYNLIFNVDGFHTPYAFTDFNTWYGANVSNYDTPSAWASGMIGYLQPILEKIAEFGARLQDYLDTSTAWQRGNDIGSVFPVVNAYILKINIFFGGFPIVQFFQWGILIMMGIFAVKIILKLLSFIPVIGGGG
jgi:hypothetical protein